MQKKKKKSVAAAEIQKWATTGDPSKSEKRKIAETVSWAVLLKCDCYKVFSHGSVVLVY